MFTKKTVRDIKLDGKTVLLRADYNIPVTDNGEVIDGYRIQQSIPTIKYLLGKKCKIVICSHLGRPDTSKTQACFSLNHVARFLGNELNRDVKFIPECVGPNVEAAVKAMKQGDIILLENVRCHPGEEANDKKFAEQLASLGDVFVQDGFGVVHRAHASTDAVTEFLPSVAGLLLEKEVDTITSAMQNPKRPLMAIIGGAKISDKIDVIETFIKTADIVAIGGAMANTFLLARGIEIGESKVDIDDVELARDIINKAHAESKKRHFIFYSPQDAVVADEIDSRGTTRIVDWDVHVIAEIENYPKRPPRSTGIVRKSEKILDIGPFSGAFMAGLMQMANMVIWNGAMGVTETPSMQGPIGPYAHGTELIIESMVGEFGHRPYTLVGGGDTAAYIEKREQIQFFDHVSTGGGASLELMAGKKLPGVEALQDKK